MKACAEYDLALTLRAAGALEPDEAARVEAHLAMCPACRAEADADAGVIAAVRLPAVTAGEREAMKDLAPRTVGAYRAEERGRARVRRAVFGGFAAAAAAIVAVAVAGVLRAPTSTPTSTSTPTPTATSTSTSTATPRTERRWRTPDLDTLWDDTSVVAVRSSAAATAYASDEVEYDDDLYATDVALAAFDDAGL